MKNRIATALASVAATLIITPASAHVSITAGTPYANAYYEAEMNIPHGCDTFDTFKVEVSLPDTVASIAPIVNFVGEDMPVTMIRNETSGEVEKLVFERSTLADHDDNRYKIAFRMKLPDAPFTTLYFPTTQYCKDQSGNILSSAWVGTGGHDSHDSTDSSELPAPSLFINPARTKGWNQYTATDHLHDMSVFDDAEIVWLDQAAYSANPVTQALIEDDVNSTTLSEIHPGQTFWVKY